MAIRTATHSIAPEPALFFEYGARSAQAEPLALFGGPLIFDSGEAEATFLYRCQDRFYAYASMLGLRTVFLVEDRAHADRYVSPLQAFHRDADTIAGATGVLRVRAPKTPLFLGCRLEDASLSSLGPDWSDEPLKAGCAVRLLLNQISPTGARLVRQMADILAEAGIALPVDADACAADGARAFQLHDKAHAMALFRIPDSDGGPRALPTAALDVEEFIGLADWEALAEVYRSRSGDRSTVTDLVVKSSRDSAGNTSGTFNAANFEEARVRLARETESWDLQADPVAQLVEARRDIEASPRLCSAAYPDARLLGFEAQRRRRRYRVRLLVQRRIPPAGGSAERPAAIGLSFFVQPDGQVETICISGQTYQDEARRHFRGAYLDSASDEAFRGSAFEAQMHRMCRRAAAKGYRGPINFDALLDRDGDYTLIHDCNPRLSAVFPPLALQRALAREGHRPRTVLSLGYRGEFQADDLAHSLESLKLQGWLYSCKTRSGALLYPSLVRPGAFDVHMLDVPPSAVTEIVSGLAAHGVVGRAPPTLYGLPGDDCAR